MFLNPIPGYGRPDAPYIIVGEAPNNKELINRRPFANSAGEKLRNMLGMLKVSPNDCYWTNVISNGRPIEHYYDSKKGFTPEGKQMVDVLLSEISQLTGKVVIACGRVALEALTGRKGIGKWQLSVITDSPVGKPVVPIAHPATIIPPREELENTYLINLGLKKAVKIATEGYTPPVMDLRIRPTYQEAYQFLVGSIEWGKQHGHISYDIEVLGEGFDKYISCFSVAYNHVSMCIPLVHFIDNRVESYFSIEEETMITILLGCILEAKTFDKVAQNILFDASFTWRQYGIRMVRMQDTMVAQNILFGDYPKGLDSITRLFTDFPYYKDDGKEFIKAGKGDQEKFWAYNALDSLVLDEAYPKMLAMLEREGNLKTYKARVAQLPQLLYMSCRGLRLDKDKYASLKSSLAASVQELTNEFQARAPGVNHKSPKQLQELFYGQLKQTPYKGKSGKVSTDKDALKRLARKDIEEAKLLQNLRKDEKLLTTYLKDSIVDQDGRVRCSINPAGTRFSRISTSKTIFGTGMNLQNWPHKLLEMLVADDGYIIIACDLNQAENRIAGYVANCEPMMKAFESSADVHTLTTQLILRTLEPTRWQEIDVKKEQSWLGDGSHVWRDWGKKANHSFNYDLGYRAFALTYELPELQSLSLVNAYHSVYPEIRQVYHTYVRNCIRSTGVVPNLLGAKVRFFTGANDRTYKQGYASIPQGTVGDIITNAISQLDDTERFGPIELLMQVHDAIAVQIPLAVGWQQIAQTIWEMKKALEVTLIGPINNKPFIVPADFYVGWTLNKDAKSTMELKHTKIQPVAELAKLLEERVYELKTQ